MSGVADLHRRSINWTTLQESPAGYCMLHATSSFRSRMRAHKRPLADGNQIHPPQRTLLLKAAAKRDQWPLLFKCPLPRLMAQHLQILSLGYPPQQFRALSI
jgi:hypothetical protein